jgi:uncharacterized protein (TIGR00106 family)
MLASFSVVPIGIGEELKGPVAEVVRLIRDSGLAYRLGAMSTTVEGDPDAVFALIRRCHARMGELAPRVLTSIVIDDRRGATGRITGKVSDVEAILGGPVDHE